MRKDRALVVVVGALVVLTLVSGVVSGCQSEGADAAVQESTGADQSSTDEFSADEEVIKAIGAGDAVALAAALEAGGDANAESTPGRPALYLAASRGNAEVARLLIDHGADIHADTWEGAILVKAAREGHHEIVEMLLDAGADIESVGKAWDGGEGTALWAAAQNAHGEAAKLLVERGGDVNTTDIGGDTSVLILAAGNDLPDLVELLLEKGADIDHQNENGATALHGAALNPFRGISSPESALVLIEHGAALDIKDNQGRTPLDVALPDVAEILREAIPTEKSEVPRITAKELKKRLDDGVDILIIDTRSKAAYDVRHLPGAIARPDRYDDVTHEQAIVAYCTWPYEEQSASLALRLYGEGFTNVAVLSGGMNAWVEADYPVEGGEAED